MANLSALDLAIIAGYMLLMMGVGALLARRGGDFTDFFLAGRALTTPILIATLVSTYYGIDVLFGTSQLAYSSGVVAWFGYSRVGYFVILVMVFALAERLKREDYTSLPDVMGRFYDDRSRYTAAAATFLYSVPATSLYGFGIIGSVLLGWSPVPSMLLFGSVALLYTLAGGIYAVAFTDVIQFVLMCVVLAIAVPMALGLVGGFGTLLEDLDPAYFKPLGNLPLGLLLIYASTHLAALVEPSFYQRIFAARSYKAVRNAILIGIVLWGAYDWVVTILGMTARTAVLEGALDPGIAGDHSVGHLLVAVLPAGLLGLFIAGVLAAQMSTMDSYCLVAGGCLCSDLYRPILNRRASEATLVRGTRLGILVAWGAGFAMASSFGQLLGLWVFMASFLISTTLAPVLLGLYRPQWRRPLAGFLSSLLGLSSVVIANAVIVLAGHYSDAQATYVLELHWLERHWVLMQEYIMFLSVPLSFVGFFVGLALDKGRRA